MEIPVFISTKLTLEHAKVICGKICLQIYIPLYLFLLVLKMLLVNFHRQIYNDLSETDIFFTSRSVSSPAIAGFPAILSPPENTGIFFPARICRYFVPIRHCRHFFFRPEIAGIFSDPKLPAYLPTRNCRHIFRPKIAGIFSDPKLPAYIPTRNCRHNFQPEIAGISSSFLSSVQ